MNAAGARTMRSRRALALIVLAVLLALVVGARELLEPSRLPETLADLTDRLGMWTYGIVTAMAFLETGAFVGLIVPGETVVVVGGLAARHGDVSLPAITALAWAGAFAGDSASFALGRRYGRNLLRRLSARLGIRDERLLGYAFAASFESATGVVGAAMAAVAAVLAAVWIGHARGHGSRLRAQTARTPC